MTTSKTRPPRPTDDARPDLRLIESSEQADLPADEVVPPLEITVHPGTDIHGVALVLLTGKLHDDSAPRVRRTIEKLIRDHRRYIVVDLDELTYDDADSFGGLVEATCSAVQRDATILFTSDPRCVLLLKLDDPEP